MSSSYWVHRFCICWLSIHSCIELQLFLKKTAELTSLILPSLFWSSSIYGKGGIWTHMKLINRVWVCRVCQFRHIPVAAILAHQATQVLSRHFLLRCPKRDLNSHTIKRQILSLLCLPIPPSGQMHTTVYLKIDKLLVFYLFFYDDSLNKLFYI